MYIMIMGYVYLMIHHLTLVSSGYAQWIYCICILLRYQINNLFSMKYYNTACLGVATEQNGPTWPT